MMLNMGIFIYFIGEVCIWKGQMYFNFIPCHINIVFSARVLSALLDRLFPSYNIWQATPCTGHGGLHPPAVQLPPPPQHLLL